MFKWLTTAPREDAPGDRPARTGTSQAAQRSASTTRWYDDMGQAERASAMQRDGYRISPLDQLYAAEHEAGLVRGRHFTRWSDEVARLKREERYEEALALLLEIISATEAAQAVENSHAEARAALIGTPARAARETPPGWTNHAAIIYRKLGDLESEIAIIDRWEAHAGQRDRGVGASHPKLLERREKARALLARNHP